MGLGVGGPWLFEVGVSWLQACLAGRRVEVLVVVELGRSAGNLDCRLGELLRDRDPW